MAMQIKQPLSLALLIGFLMILASGSLVAQPLGKLMDALSWDEEPDSVVEQGRGNVSEQHLTNDQASQQWVHDPSMLEEDTSDRIGSREVATKEANTVKLRGVVPPVRFDSGVARIPAGTVEELRSILASMRNRANVRLHLIGHADNQPLSSSLAAQYGDNAGLSRERAGEVAELFQDYLSLDPASITYEWMGDTQPLATNETPEGRAQNRRVEVEVWYDEFEDGQTEEEVVISNDVKRIKVCRVQTLCKLNYVEGENKRARVQNLIAPLHYDESSIEVTTGFTERIKRVLANLGDRQNVVVKFIGYTDNTPLDERSERLYGDHEGLSKARAWRVALAVSESLGLGSNAVEGDGFGSERPLASNDTTRGRALNRRIEVEFWYDDPLQELPDEPQLCPVHPGAETITRIYRPAWGSIPQIALQDGELQIPSGLRESLARAMDDVADKADVRLRFVGYTGNQTLDRRTALVYGDDIGLAAARARRAMELVTEEMGLSPAQAEFEGRGYVQSDDVVNAGFIQGEDSYVSVQVVYDELAVLESLEGMSIDPLRLELEPENPFSLNLMRISVNGEPVDDPGRSSADIQRCTDVALNNADIHFGFDNLKSSPSLSADAYPSRVELSGDLNELAEPVLFRMHTNYAYAIEKSEVRIFETGESTRATPVSVVEVTDGLATWFPQSGEIDLSPRRLQYVLRAYGRDGNFDETAPRPLWLGKTLSGDAVAVGDDAVSGLDDQAQSELYAAYGTNGLALQNIAMSSGTVRVQGSGIPAGHNVWLAGQTVPVDASGNFVAEQILPEGMHTVEVAVLDEQGNGELFLRDLSFESNDWFYVGMADLTLNKHRTSGPIDLLQGQNSTASYDEVAEGRLAFYANGKFGDKWRLTTSLDTREGPIDELFSNFLGKSPDSLFRRIDPDYYYPTFGDDSTVEEMAPTSGKFYLKVSQDDNHMLWGNFRADYNDNELVQVERGLFGANLRYESSDTTTFGEHRFAFDGFAADPGTVSTRQEFRGTGGSLYFLQHQDLLQGGERIRIELRDSTSGLVTGTVTLQNSVDYDIDYLQGTILLAEPLASTVNNGLLVRTGAQSGDEAYLVVYYEYTPGFEEMDAVALGAQGHYWFNDKVKIGLTGNLNEQDELDSSLQAADITWRMSSNTWAKLQTAGTEGLTTATLSSNDGGYSFLGEDQTSFVDRRAKAYRLDFSLGLSDVFDNQNGRISFYAQNLDAGYASPGLSTLYDTEHLGVSLSLPVGERWEIAGKSDIRSQDQGVSIDSHELNLAYQLSPQWEIQGGVRQDVREDNSSVVPLTQQVGSRTDAVIQLGYDPGEEWSAYGFLQDTLEKTDNRSSNGRFGLGGAYQVTEKLGLEGEVSGGELGTGAKMGTTYSYSEQTSLYLNYALENERTDNVSRIRNGREGNLITGIKTRLSDSTSVYLEERYIHGSQRTGLTHTSGVNLAPSHNWNLGMSIDIGTLQDVQTGAETERKALGVNASYSLGQVNFSSGVEYRQDINEQLDLQTNTRQTWLFRNSFNWQSSESARWLGKLNHSVSESSLGQFYDGDYTEASIGYAFRPVTHNRLNSFVKYTYFYNKPSSDQVVLQNTVTEYIQKSHVAAVDLTYDLTSRWSLGGKYAYRMGQLSLNRENPEYFDSKASLYVLRTDYRLFENWEMLLEARMLALPDFDESRSGGLISLSRYLGNHFKVGLGYNFTDFSDDLTDLSYDHQGIFLNIAGVL